MLPQHHHAFSQRSRINREVAAKTTTSRKRRKKKTGGSIGDLVVVTFEMQNTTSFSSITDPALHRREWRSSFARDTPAISPRQASRACPVALLPLAHTWMSTQIPRRYHSQLRYDLLDVETQATVTAAHSRSVERSKAFYQPEATSLPSRPTSGCAGADVDAVESSKTNMEELKWFEHRWLNKHGRTSQLKEIREKTVLMRHWFESLDADGSGEVGLNELEDPLVSVGLARSRDDVQKLIDEVDKDGKGEVTFNEFLSLMYPKKVKRPRKRTPLHQPKVRASVEESPPDLHAATATTSQAKADTLRPSSPCASPRAPKSPSAARSAVATSLRQSPRIARSSQSGAAESVTAAKVNPVVKLFEDLQSGKLGDLAIPFPVLIAAYRRRMLLNAHMADDPAARRQAHPCCSPRRSSCRVLIVCVCTPLTCRLGISVLQALESSRREVVVQPDHRRSESIAQAAHSFLHRRSSVSVPSATAPTKSGLMNRKRSTVKHSPEDQNSTAQLPALS